MNRLSTDTWLMILRRISAAENQTLLFDPEFYEADIEYLRQKGLINVNSSDESIQLTLTLTSHGEDVLKESDSRFKTANRFMAAGAVCIAASSYAASEKLAHLVGIDSGVGYPYLLSVLGGFALCVAVDFLPRRLRYFHEDYGKYPPGSRKDSIRYYLVVFFLILATIALTLLLDS